MKTTTKSVNSASMGCKGLEQISKEKIIRDLKVKEKWDKIQPEFINGRSCQVNLIFFFGKMVAFLIEI